MLTKLTWNTVEKAQDFSQLPELSLRRFVCRTSLNFLMLLFIIGTDINYVVLENLSDELKDKADFYFDTPVSSNSHLDNSCVYSTEDERLQI